MPALYDTTYYPSAATTGRAAIVDVAADGEVSGIEIRMIRQRLTFTISGLVSGIPGEGSGAVVTLMPGENAQGVARTASAGPDGKFAFGKLQASGYRLYARSSSGGVQLYSEDVDVKLDGADVPNINLGLSPPGEMTGTIELAGEPAGSMAERPMIRLRRIGGGVERTAEANQDGGFRVAGMAPGHYRVSVDRLPENAYVRGVQLDGAEVGRELNLSQSASNSRLKITVGRNGAEISGSILDQTGVRAIAPIAAVWLLDSGKEVPVDEELQRMTRVGQEGTYSLHGIPPGHYRLFALDLLRVTGFDADRQTILRKAVSMAADIEIREGDRISRDLKMWGKEDIAAQQ
jgi:hypothetical protein